MKMRTGFLLPALLPALLLTAAPAFAASSSASFREAAADTLFIGLQPGEKVWGARVADGSLMPYAPGFEGEMYYNGNNQIQPLLITDMGRYVWSEEPFAFRVEDDGIVITAETGGMKTPLHVTGTVQTGVAGETLADAARYASEHFFPASGVMPPEEFLRVPQYNTWIELMYDQNQEGILRYAKGILDNGLPPGILMIDDTWQEDYGKWVCHPGRFPDPKGMIDELHRMGFKVMLWVCPLVSMDQYLICREIMKDKGFLLKPAFAGAGWEDSSEPYPVTWWNGVSASLDLSNPAAVAWFKAQLDRLMAECGVDGFKFDGGDPIHYPADALSMSGVSAQEQCRLYAAIGLDYPYNEYRSGWKMGGQPLVQRLGDKNHSWEDLRKLIPDMLAENLLGYTFSCPDMVGGGQFAAFLDPDKIDRDLILRSAQCHAVMPMMQFSVAPWRILDSVRFAAVKKVVALRQEKITPRVMALARRSAETGEPIMAPLEYFYPHSGYAEVKDQFMLGSDFMVAPMLSPGEGGREVVLPEGRWKADDGKVWRGGRTITIEVPLDRIPYFEKIR